MLRVASKSFLQIILLSSSLLSYAGQQAVNSQWSATIKNESKMKISCHAFDVSVGHTSSVCFPCYSNSGELDINETLILTINRETCPDSNTCPEIDVSRIGINCSGGNTAGYVSVRNVTSGSFLKFTPGSLKQVTR